MGRIMRGSEIARRIGVPRFLLGAALGVFGSLLLGALGMATAAWASDESAEATGLAAVTDPLTDEVSDMSRLAARLVPQDQQGHRPLTDEQTASGLVSGLTEPVDSLVDEQVDVVRTVLHDQALTEAPNRGSIGDDATGVVTPLLGDLARGTASVTERPADAVSGVFQTVAPTARLVTDGLLPLSDATPPGGVHLTGEGQPSFTALQPATDPAEVAAALNAVSPDRSAADFGCFAALDGTQSSDPAPGEEPRQRTNADADAQRWAPSGPALPDLNAIPGGATGSYAGTSVDNGKSAVDVSPHSGGEQVSFARTVSGELGRPMDRAAELSVAPD